MRPPPDLPLWRQAMAMIIMITGVLLVYAGPVAEMIYHSWVLFVVGIVCGLVCGVLGCALVAQRITCERCGRFIISVGGRPRNCPIKNCPGCGTPFFSDKGS